ncbi:MAG: enoyl-CoA hydratase/isomerase family protein, partial [Syntrophomonadaceae bacterium]|nr:enoyl-CoA hydratase/isomerase family protein [Syntrophomonadaceae bacterium]
MATYKNLLVTKESPIAILTLNRPDRLNIFGVEVWQEMEQALREIEEMDNLRAVVINAKGKHFAAGVDLKELSENSLNFTQKYLAYLQSVYNKLDDFPVPVIIAIQGLCLGSGTELALACDLRVVTKNAKLALPEVRFGLSPDMGGTTRLTKLVGPGQAKKIIFTCDQIDADKAEAIGLVEYVVEEEALMETAMKIAHQIASMPPIAVRMAKKGINLATESSRMAGLLFEQAQAALCSGT